MVRFGEARKRRDLVWYGEAGQARHGEMGRNGRGWSRVGSGKFSEEKRWIVSTRMSARTA